MPYLRAVRNYLGNASTSLIRGLVEPGYFAQQKALRKIGFRDDSPIVCQTLQERIFEVSVSRDNKRYEVHFDNNGKATFIIVTPGHWPIYPGDDGTRERPMTAPEMKRFRGILRNELHPELRDRVFALLLPYFPANS